MDRVTSEGDGATLSRGGETITGAPIVGWEQIPATALVNGVEFGYAYIATEEPRIPAVITS